VSVNVGSRGNAGFEFTVRTAAKDLHSGRYGGIVPNALHVIADMVSALHASDGSVAVPQFYQDVKDTGVAELEALESVPLDEQSLFATIGSRPLGEPGRSTLERLWLRPCLDVNGMWGGYMGPGGKTVIPHEAHAKLTVRLVPSQDPSKVAQAVKDFLVSRCPVGCELEFGVDRGQSAAYEVPLSHPLLHVVEAALTKTHGQRPYRVRVGGTLPISAIVRDELGVDTVMLSYSTADEDFHAPNEFFRLSSIDDGLVAWTELFRLAGELDVQQLVNFDRRD
jgi:acetylornithine deacetylase/succinyl-diaminopimelate desuccinylase-like protein